MGRVWGAFMGRNCLEYIWRRLMPKGLAQLKLKGHLVTGDALYAQKNLSHQVVGPRPVGVPLLLGSEG